MAFLTNLELETAREVGGRFGLDVQSVEPLAAGSVNSNFKLRDAGGQNFFGRIYEEQDAQGAAAEATLLRELAELGVPVVAPLTPLPPAEAVFAHGKPFAVFPWVVGEDLCHARITAAHCFALGAGLAQVHLATASLSQVPRGRFGVSDLLIRLDYIEANSIAYLGDVAIIRQALASHVAARDLGLPSGLTHGDLFRDNVLWTGDRLSGLLDFESACEGPFIYDLMVCVLAWCYTSTFDLERASALVSGYQCKRSLTSAERRAASNEAGFACLRFATTRITDFAMRTPEGMQPKRSYQRFLDRLRAIEAGVLNPVFGA